MQRSADLRSESEFVDLYLEPLPLLKAAARRFPRFRRRARRAARRGKGGNSSIYDDYRIAVLNDLDSPELRGELQRRLGRCIDRLKYGNDEAKIETAMFISLFLSDRASKLMKGKRPLPLGGYGLVTTLYEDSFDRAMEMVPSARGIVGDDLYELWCGLRREQDLAARLERDRALAHAWQRQGEHLGEGLWLHIAGGAMSFEPSFFTSDEIALVMAKMERRHWSKPWSPSRHIVFLATSSFVTCIRETVDEVVSPQRIAALVRALRAMGQRALESDSEETRSWVPALQVAIDDLLDAEVPSQSVVLQALYAQDLFEAMSEAEEMKPHWQRFLKLLQKSRLFKQLGEGGL